MKAPEIIEILKKRYNDCTYVIKPSMFVREGFTTLSKEEEDLLDVEVSSKEEVSLPKHENGQENLVFSFRGDKKAFNIYESLLNKGSAILHKDGDEIIQEVIKINKDGVIWGEKLDMEMENPEVEELSEKETKNIIFGVKEGGEWLENLLSESELW